MDFYLNVGYETPRTRRCLPGMKYQTRLANRYTNTGFVENRIKFMLKTEMMRAKMLYQKMFLFCA